MSLRFLIAAAVFVSSLDALPAQAYVCTRVTNSVGVLVEPAISQVWVNRCIPYYIHRESNLLSGDAVRQLLRESFDVWESETCSDLTFVDGGYTDQNPGFDPMAEDNLNVITAIEDAARTGEFFTDPGMVAITITAFAVQSGEIFDGDIVINASNFIFDDVQNEAACRTQSREPFDLQSIMVHEIGHFIGFDHAPDLESTMYFSAPTCEIKKRTLTEDDMQGLCTVYPVGEASNTCFPPSDDYDDVSGASRFRDQCNLDDGCSCRSNAHASSSSAWPGLGLLIGLVGLIWWRRRMC